MLLSSSVAALTDCMRNKTLAKFFRDRQASLKRSLPLGSYLLKPVQRILKYHLLLQVLNIPSHQLSRLTVCVCLFSSVFGVLHVLLESSVNM